MRYDPRNTITTRPNRRPWISRAISYFVFGLYTVLTIYPLFWLFTSAFKTNYEIQTNPLALPVTLEWTNFIQAWEFANLGTLFTNSVIYTASSTILVLLTSSMAAYAFAKLPYRQLSKVLFAIIGFGILISTHSIIIPLFLFFRGLGLTGNTYTGVILAYTAIGLPLAIFVVTEYMKSVPDSLIESAFLDGAGHLRVFASIALPIASPVLVTIAIITVLGSWNEFLLNFIITGARTRNLQVGVYSFANPMVPQYHLQFAALTIATLPIVVVYFVFNRRITRGVVAGAVKE